MTPLVPWHRPRPILPPTWTLPRNTANRPSAIYRPHFHFRFYRVGERRTGELSPLCLYTSMTDVIFPVLSFNGWPLRTLRCTRIRIRIHMYSTIVGTCTYMHVCLVEGKCLAIPPDMTLPVERMSQRFLPPFIPSP